MKDFLTVHHPSNSKQTIRGYVLFIIYLAGSLLLVLHHELWKDEAHHWLLARDSDSLLSLVYNGRYEGHPKLWNALMHIVSWFTHDPLYVQLLHWSIGSMAIWFLIFRSPFPGWVRFSLPFTYLLFYEYQVISRNYAICVILLFAICDLLCRENVRYTLLAVLLVLLANASLFGLIIATGVSLGIAFHHIDLPNRKFNFRPLAAFAIICSVGFILSVYQIVPPSDHFLTTNHNNAALLSGTRINKLLSVFYRGVFHIPNIGEASVWNSNLVFNYIPDLAKAAISLLAWTLPFLFFLRHRKLLFLFFFCMGGIAFFAYISPLIISVRHSGFAFIMLIVCFWLAHSKIFKSETSPMPLTQYRWVLTGIISINILSTVIFGYLELTRPFSMSEQAADYLSEEQLQHLPIVSTQNTGTSLSTYLQKPLYYMDKGGMGSYVIWSTDAFILDKSIIDGNLKSFAESESEFIIASEYSYGEDFLGSCWQIELLKSFKGSIVRSEQFEVYRARKTCE